MRLNKDTSSTLPSLSIGIVMPVLLLFSSMLAMYHLLNYDSLFYISGIAAVVLMLITMVIIYRNEQLRDFYLIVSIIALCGMYSYGAVVCMNCAFDKKTSSHCTVTVSDKYKRKPWRHYNYYFTVSTSQPQLSGQNLETDSYTYHNTSINDTAGVALHDGVLSTAWYEVDRK
jgi:hypothetical protein